MRFELNNSSLCREHPSYLAVCYLVIIDIVLQIPWVLPCSCVVLLFIFFRWLRALHPQIPFWNLQKGKRSSQRSYKRLLQLVKNKCKVIRTTEIRTLAPEHSNKYCRFKSIVKELPLSIQEVVVSRLPWNL